ncbi:unnamed protein product [Haemonchus placei]|uniref:50S ribosomal protein L23 n=1 Tax=Haemonchus placei TaxID=6290 RepID=A0A0N4WQ48_HAEPC|nr:unnamed protein product [Haemonchus placei]
MKNAIRGIDQVTACQPLATLQKADLFTAEINLIKLAQATLSREKLVKLINLQLYKDENGVIRRRGRIRVKHLAKATQEPILLPKTDDFTN